MTKIYGQHDKAFEHVSAYVVLHDGKRVATIAFKFSKSGLRVYCYAHWIGTEMVRGWAGGGGYDRKSAAAGVACSLMANPASQVGNPGDQAWYAFVDALGKDDGASWDRRLTDAGFEVLQAV